MCTHTHVPCFIIILSLEISLPTKLHCQEKHKNNLTAQQMHTATSLLLSVSTIYSNTNKKKPTHGSSSLGKAKQHRQSKTTLQITWLWAPSGLEAALWTWDNSYKLWNWGQTLRIPGQDRMHKAFTLRFQTFPSSEDHGSKESNIGTALSVLPFGNGLWHLPTLTTCRHDLRVVRGKADMGMCGQAVVSTWLLHEKLRYAYVILGPQTLKMLSVMIKQLLFALDVKHKENGSCILITFLYFNRTRFLKLTYNSDYPWVRRQLQYPYNT